MGHHVALGVTGPSPMPLTSQEVDQAMRLVNVRRFGPTSDGSPAEFVAGTSGCCPREAASLRQDNPGTAIESLRPIGWEARSRSEGNVWAVSAESMVFAMAARR